MCLTWQQKQDMRYWASSCGRSRYRIGRRNKLESRLKAQADDYFEWQVMRPPLDIRRAVMFRWTWSDWYKRPDRYAQPIGD